MLFFKSWSSVFDIIIMAVILYPSLILLLRISGKRTLSKMNMFDLVITVALGSTVATILLSSTVTFFDGITALAMLILLQFIVTWLGVRSRAFNSLIKGEPQLLYYNGNYIESALKKERINRDEIKQALRAQGIASFSHVEAIVLETDGSLSVVKQNNQTHEFNALTDVEGIPHEN